MATSVHTVPYRNGEEGWANEVDGHVQTRHRVKDAAIREGMRIAKQRRCKHVIHDRDGTIAVTKSYGDDTSALKG